MDPAPAPLPPVRPKPEEFGLTEHELGRRTARDILLSDELASVLMVVITILSIWYWQWWGIAVACVALGALWLVRRVISVTVRGRIDTAREAYLARMETYEAERRAHDEAMWEHEQRCKQTSE